MKKLLLASIFALGFATTQASADVIDDPLHGTCLVGCVANAGPPPNITIGNPPLNFGFQASPANSGALTMDFLVPTAGGIIPSISVTGSMNGAQSFTATLFSSTPWTSGQLDAYLGIDASPTNPIDAFADSSGGFFVYTGLAGNYSLPQQGTPLSNGTTPLWSVAGGVPGGTSIVGFLDDGEPGGRLVATANSSALHTVGVPGPIVGAGLPGLFGLGLLALARVRQRRNWWRRDEG
jgi:hypothetical protein